MKLLNEFVNVLSMTYLYNDVLYICISVLHNNHFMLIPVIDHSGIELPAMYKVNTIIKFNLMDRIYVH